MKKRQNYNIDNGVGWEKVNFSDPNSIRGLVRFRYGILEDNCDSVADIMSVYADLDILVARTPLKEQQCKVLQLFADNFNDIEIGEQLGISGSAVESQLHNIFVDLSEQNLWDWRRVILKKTGVGYKMCKSCRESHPDTNKFYRMDKGYTRSKCKRCDKIGRNASIGFALK